ncbi:MAG: energy transducer TonB [Tardiphaga sp.]
MSELDHTTSWRMWVIAGIFAVLLHVGGIGAAVYQMQQEEEDDGLGANAIEVGMEMVSPDVQQTDLPQGPDSDQSVASPAVQEQKAVEKPVDLPKDTPHESEEPDQVVTENTLTKPVEETPEKEQKQQQASQESVASEAAAQQKLEDSKVGEKAQAQEAGIGNDKKKLAAKWSKQLVAYLNKNLRYPAERDRKKAEVLVTFEINRVGKVLAVRVEKSSGDPVFDAAAIAMVRRSDPLPPPPPLQADESLVYTIPAVFNVNTKK